MSYRSKKNNNNNNNKWLYFQNGNRTWVTEKLPGKRETQHIVTSRKKVCIHHRVTVSLNIIAVLWKKDCPHRFVQTKGKITPPVSDNLGDSAWSMSVGLSVLWNKRSAWTSRRASRSWRQSPTQSTPHINLWNHFWIFRSFLESFLVKPINKGAQYSNKDLLRPL